MTIKSTKTFFLLLIVLAIIASFSQFLPMGNFMPQNIPQKEMPFSPFVIAFISGLSVLIIYGGLGYFGLFLSRKLGFPEICDEKVSNKQRFLTPLYWGIGLGLFLIIGDFIFSPINSFGHFPHPPFPTSFFASISAGIGEEMIFRLFFISFWVWLISFVILKKKYFNQVFWFITVLSAIAFGFSHLPALMYLMNYQTLAAVPIVLLIEILLLNGAIGLVAAKYFRKYGFLAAIGIHFWTDIVWHTIYGLIK